MSLFCFEVENTIKTNRL